MKKLIYKEFIEKHKGFAKPGMWEEFQFGTLKPPTDKRTDDLKKMVVSELNIGFLLGGAYAEYDIVSEVRFKDYIERESLFTNASVGSFRVLQLEPREGNGCTIIGLHGHSQESGEFKNKYFCEDLAKEGFNVLIPTFRAMGCNIEEETETIELARNGFTLMGIRVFEAILLVGYVKPFKVGLMGHSGGGEVAYLTSIIADKEISALAFDMYPKPFNRCGGRVHCQTIPGLDGYNQQLCEDGSIKIPHKKFEYKYINSRDEVINFFKENLCQQNSTNVVQVEAK